MTRQLCCAHGSGKDQGAVIRLTIGFKRFPSGNHVNPGVTFNLGFIARHMRSLPNQSGHPVIAADFTARSVCRGSSDAVCSVPLLARTLRLASVKHLALGKLFRIDRLANQRNGSGLQSMRGMQRRNQNGSLTNSGDRFSAIPRDCNVPDPDVI